MAFYFAWVDPEETTFESTHHREDEAVLAFEISHQEGDFAALRIDIQNPRVGLLSVGRKRWAWLAHTDGVTTSPLFFGRLIGLPQEMSEDVVSLSLIAKPLNYQTVKAALASTMKQPEYYDPMFINVEQRDEPDTVLEARPMVWSVDRITHEVTASNILEGEDGTIAVGGDAFYDSIQCSYSGAPQRKVVIEASVNWTQYAAGTIQVDFNGISTYTGDGLLTDWPRQGQRVGAGWEVAEGYAKDSYSNLNNTSIRDDSGKTTYVLYRWTVNGYVVFAYEAQRGYTETATFTMSSSLQEIVTEAGDEDTIAMSVSGNADEPCDAGDTMPIGDVRRRAYFSTERGNLSVAYLANIAASRLLASARCIEVSFGVPFSYADSLSLRKSATIDDPRLPGGTATGKIKSYSIYTDGNSGEMGCTVTIACTPGYGGTAPTEAGTASYADASYVAGYQTYTGSTQTVVVDANGDPLMTISNIDEIAVNDDGLDLFNMTAATCVLEKTVTNTSSSQQSYIFPSSSDTYAALTEHPTRIGVRLKPVNGGPFETFYEISSSDLVVPKTIDLEAAST